MKSNFNNFGFTHIYLPIASFPVYSNLKFKKLGFFNRHPRVSLGPLIACTSKILQLIYQRQFTAKTIGTVVFSYHSKHKAQGFRSRSQQATIYYSTSSGSQCMTNYFLHYGTLSSTNNVGQVVLCGVNRKIQNTVIIYFKGLANQFS